MKLMKCVKCGDIVAIIETLSRSCYCGKIAGKYLDDSITAVVNKDALVFGIDNNGFAIAQHYALENKNAEHRYDYFFTGWIPTKPGEVIVVKTAHDVHKYPMKMKDEDKQYTSTWPSRVSEENDIRKTVHQKCKFSLSHMMMEKHFGDIHEIQGEKTFLRSIKKIFKDIFIPDIGWGK